MTDDVYRKRIDALAARRDALASGKEACERQRVALIREGKPVGDLWREIDAKGKELSELDRELSELRNFASDHWATARHETDRGDFDAANRALIGKRSNLGQMREYAIGSVLEAAERLRDYIRELDELERAQLGRAATLNQTAAALGMPADFALPDERQPNYGTLYSRPDAATQATAKLMSMARHGSDRDFLVALAEAAHACAA